MSVAKYDDRFYELARYAIITLPTEFEQIQCFIRGLRLLLHRDKKWLMTLGKSFFDTFVLVYSLDEMDNEAQKGSNKRP